MTDVVSVNGQYCITVDGAPAARVIPAVGAADFFTQIDENAWLWRRRTEAPVDRMRMELTLIGAPDFTMVPAVSYNGNGWGDTPEYVGDRDVDGTPWSWAAHRVTIPACTYSENSVLSLALMSKANADAACSLYLTEEGERHALIFPEEEKPRTLQRHFWGEPFEGKTEPRDLFEGIIYAAPSDGTRHRYRGLVDFAFRFYGHPLTPPRPASELYRLSLAYTRFLFERERDGFCGFVTGSQWHPDTCSYKKKEHRYELGWVGQNASMANALINTGDPDDLGMAVEALDAWLRFGEARGFLSAKIDYHEWRLLPLETMTGLDPLDWGEDQYESLLNKLGKKFERDEKGRVVLQNDACCLGTGAEQYFIAFDALKKRGVDKPEYLKAALAACDLALASMDESGLIAKSWDNDGRIIRRDGTVGCFFVIPLILAHKKTGEEKYLSAAKRAFYRYYSDFDRDGFTTAGALDTYSIDKESASPLLRAALALYDATDDASYIEKAENIAWYLCTWMMHYTLRFPADSLIAKLGIDTFGLTSVSTPHQALDQYALRDVPSFLRLFELTGNRQWRERAAALWCGANQGVSDGTLWLNGRLRPAGSQDEAYFHTRWGRHSVKPFSPSQWLPAWPCAFRLEDLRSIDNAFLDEGLKKISPKGHTHLRTHRF